MCRTGTTFRCRFSMLVRRHLRLGGRRKFILQQSTFMAQPPQIGPKEFPQIQAHEIQALSDLTLPQTPANPIDALDEICARAAIVRGDVRPASHSIDRQAACNSFRRGTKVRM